MASAFILMSQGKADELKVAWKIKECMCMVAQFSMIFGMLLKDLIFILPLQSKLCVNQSLDQAELSLSDIKHFDLYSCFPSAVQIAKKGIGNSRRKKGFNGYGRFALLWRALEILTRCFQLRKW